jgi:hypothetical protein
MAKKGSVSQLNSGKIGWFTEVVEEQQWGRVSRHSKTSKEGVVASQAWKSLLHRLWSTLADQPRIGAILGILSSLNPLKESVLFIDPIVKCLRRSPLKMLESLLKGMVEVHLSLSLSFHFPHQHAHLYWSNDLRTILSRCIVHTAERISVEKLERGTFPSVSTSWTNLQDWSGTSRLRTGHNHSILLAAIIEWCWVSSLGTITNPMWNQGWTITPLPQNQGLLVGSCSLTKLADRGSLWAEPLCSSLTLTTNWSFSSQRALSILGLDQRHPRVRWSCGQITRAPTANWDYSSINRASNLSRGILGDKQGYLWIKTLQEVQEEEEDIEAPCLNINHFPQACSNSKIINKVRGKSWDL